MSNETANMDFKYVLQDFNNVYIEIGRAHV